MEFKNYTCSWWDKNSLVIRFQHRRHTVANSKPKSLVFTRSSEEHHVEQLPKDIDTTGFSQSSLAVRNMSLIQSGNWVSQEIYIWLYIFFGLKIRHRDNHYIFQTSWILVFPVTVHFVLGEPEALAQPRTVIFWLEFLVSFDNLLLSAMNVS